MNIYFEFQVYVFSNGSNMTKCHNFCTTTIDNNTTKAIAMNLKKKPFENIVRKGENAGN